VSELIIVSISLWYNRLEARAASPLLAMFARERDHPLFQCGCTSLIFFGISSAECLPNPISTWLKGDDTRLVSESALALLVTKGAGAGAMRYLGSICKSPAVQITRRNIAVRPTNIPTMPIAMLKMLASRTSVLDFASLLSATVRLPI
jgi:hypothetical protein